MTDQERAQAVVSAMNTVGFTFEDDVKIVLEALAAVRAEARAKIAADQYSTARGLSRMSKPKIYIAGPMTGFPEFNFPAFHEAQRKWEAAGWEVFNPAAKDEELGFDGLAYVNGDVRKAVADGFDLRAALKWDTAKICEADAIYMLRGWQHSSGAVAEHALAVAIQKAHPEYEIIYA